MRFKPVSVSLAPNLISSDVRIALKYLFSPYHWFFWRNGKFIKKASEKLEELFGYKKVFLLDKGRNALYLLFKSLGIKQDDEVIIQAYTCVVVPNAVIWSGAKPVYVDIDEKTLNMDPDLIEAKITSKTKAIVVQHNFGLVVDLEKIKAIADKHNLFLIEDCAHSLGAKYKGKYVGNYGNASIYTFGRDKVVSTVNGGAISSNNPEIIKKIESEYEKVKIAGNMFTFRSLFHIFSFSFIIPLYYFFNIGKILLVVFQKIGLLEKVYNKSERIGGGGMPLFGAMPNCLCEVLLGQLENINEFNKHRIAIAQIYADGIKNTPKVILPQKSKSDNSHIYFRYTLLTANPLNLINFAKKNKYILGDWYNRVIVPKDAEFSRINYMEGDCPKAENIALRSVNLPNSIATTKKDAEILVDIINKFFEK